jgi:hypothetical protein
MGEHDEQAAVITWATVMSGAYPELALLYAIPNGAALAGKHRAWRKLEAEGAKSGVPDLCLPVARHGYHGLYIELKFGSNKPSDKQAAWLDRLTEQGYLAVACWGADEAIETIGDYLKEEKTR